MTSNCSSKWVAMNNHVNRPWGWPVVCALAAVMSLASTHATAQPDRERGGERDRPEERMESDRPPHAERMDAPDRGADHGEGRRGPFGDRAPLSDEQAEAALEVIELIYPESAEQMRANWKEDPDQVKRMLDRRFPRVRYMLSLKERNPEMYELRIADITLTRQSEQLVRQMREAKKADDEKAFDDHRDALEDVIEEHFDVRQEIREIELEWLRERLERMEEEVDDRARDKRDLIEQRLLELAGGENGAKW